MSNNGDKEEVVDSLPVKESGVGGQSGHQKSGGGGQTMVQESGRCEQSGHGPKTGDGEQSGHGPREWSLRTVRQWAKRAVVANSHAILESGSGGQSDHSLEW